MAPRTGRPNRVRPFETEDICLHGRGIDKHNRTALLPDGRVVNLSEQEILIAHLLSVGFRPGR